MTNFNKTIGKRSADTAGCRIRSTAYCCAYGQWRMTVEALARMADCDENRHGRIYPGPMAFMASKPQAFPCRLSTLPGTRTPPFARLHWTPGCVAFLTSAGV